MKIMKFKRYLILLFIQLCLSGIVEAQDIQEQPDTLASLSNLPDTEWLKQANELYINEKYQDAIDLYEKILREKGESVVVHYNLGNAYYKKNEIAPAILHYERALLRDPGNEDIRVNLEMAKQKTVDKIEPIGMFFLSQWLTDIRNIFSTNQWSWAGIVTFLFFIGCLALFFFSSKRLWKKIGFYAGIILLIGTISSNIFAYRQKEKLTAKDTAIIFAPTVTVKGSPDKSGVDIVVLHEGSKVFIKSKLGNWSEIVLEDGNVGWIENNKIEII
ncbi:MAG: tetratricopeptide repeat protein [Dysgonamonadaceae bacterium]|jgi:tetratricopeptide (TPR) repeat protein|nr:tetratricopeptide repeat protein [Dysgonamonadaceae bacterium]